MKTIKYLILVVGLFAGFGLMAIPTSVYATTPTTGGVLTNSCGVTSGASTTVLCQQSGKNDFDTYVGIIVNSLLLILGAVSVVVIIIAGITYTTSGGDSALVAKAKNTLLYAVVGLVVAILAYAIVNYVITAFGA